MSDFMLALKKSQVITKSVAFILQGLLLCGKHLLAIYPVVVAWSAGPIKDISVHSVRMFLFPQCQLSSFCIVLTYNG